MDVQDRQDCDKNIRRVRKLLGSGIFDSNNSGHMFLQSAFIDLMICMRDLMHKTETYAERISFVDDILINAYVKDVTDAITAVRDACCHIDSFKKKFDEHGNRGSFMVGYGKCFLLKIDELELKSEYEDDIAVFYGKNRLYMKRHIVRAFQEAVERLGPSLTNA